MRVPRGATTRASTGAVAALIAIGIDPPQGAWGAFAKGPGSSTAAEATIRQRENEPPPRLGSAPFEPWHASPVATVCAALESGPAGLDDGEAARRLAACGRNSLTPPKRRAPLVRWGRRRIFMKGASEAVLARCRTQDGADDRPLDTRLVRRGFPSRWAPQAPVAARRGAAGDRYGSPGGPAQKRRSESWRAAISVRLGAGSRTIFMGSTGRP